MASAKIGHVVYSEPRAVQIAAKYIDGGDPDDKTPHSAVHGEFNILLESVIKSKKVMAEWPKLMAEVAERVDAILEEIDGEEDATGP